MELASSYGGMLVASNTSKYTAEYRVDLKSNTKNTLK